MEIPWGYFAKNCDPLYGVLWSITTFYDISMGLLFKNIYFQLTDTQFCTISYSTYRLFIRYFDYYDLFPILSTITVFYILSHFDTFLPRADFSYMSFDRAKQGLQTGIWIIQFEGWPGSQNTRKLFSILASFH